jgi:hypothetical protein
VVTETDLALGDGRRLHVYDTGSGDGPGLAVQLAVRVLRVRPGDREEQFASDITDDRHQMFVAKANGQVVAYGRVAELAADEAGPETPAGYYLSGVVVDPGERRM